VMGGEYIEFFGSVNPSCLIRFKKILRSRLRPRLSRQPWLASAGGLEFWKWGWGDADYDALPV